MRTSKEADTSAWLKSFEDRQRASKEADSETWLKSFEDRQRTSKEADTSAWLKSFEDRQRASKEADSKTWLKSFEDRQRTSKEAETSAWLKSFEDRQRASKEDDSKAWLKSLEDRLRAEQDAVIVKPSAQKLLGPGNSTTLTLGEIEKLAQPQLWKESEKHLGEMYGAASQRKFAVQGTGSRFVDILVTRQSQLFAGEVKSYRPGWITRDGIAQINAVPLSDKIKEQIQKDVQLRAIHSEYDPRWIFTGAPPSDELRRALKDARIVIVEHGAHALELQK